MPDGDRTLIRELAHELRDALSPLASAADLARLRHFDPETSRLLAEKVERAMRRALKILDAFVLAEESEHTALQLAFQAVPLDEIVQAACNQLAPEEAGRCRVLPAGQNTRVRADAGWSARVLTAVLQYAGGRALRESVVEVHTLAGVEPEIRVRASLDPASEPREAWFTDYRARNARMALRTARRIMSLQGGGLDLVRPNDEECEFILRFCGLRAEPEAQSQDAGPRARAPRPGAAGGAAQCILIVDDSYEVRRAYREALVTLGYTVLEAADAEQALGEIAGTTPDVALIDIHLPRMNGYRLAQAIRARVGRGIYLVMLSGMALDAVTRGLAQEAGFDDCLDKMAGPLALREQLVSSAERNSLGNVER